MITLGCIADDFTGGTDVAAALRRAGLSVALLFDVPDEQPMVPDTTDAVVIALKTRTVPAAEAVDQSLSALAWLRRHGVERVYFKYCSTFDSTDDGNIGPVADALLERLGEPMTLVCPASPEHGRTMYQGHLFVGDRLLSESSMRHHPLTPMRDSRIVDVLARQTSGAVDLLSLSDIRRGQDAIRSRLGGLAAAGVRHVVVDALTDADLSTVAEAATGLRTMTGGAGLAGALGAVLSRLQSADDPRAEISAQLPEGPSVVLAGSCSAATLAQVAVAADVLPAHRLDPAATPGQDELADRASQWLREAWDGHTPVLIYSSAGPEERRAAGSAMGAETPAILERTLGRLAREAVELGARRVVVAGGETSGAVVQALGVEAVVVAGEADRGVPWCLTVDGPRLALLLKSGNFGGPDLLVRATKEGL